MSDTPTVGVHDDEPIDCDRRPRCRLLYRHVGRCYEEMHAGWTDQVLAATAQAIEGVDLDALRQARDSLRRSFRSETWNRDICPAQFGDAELAQSEQPSAIITSLQAWIERTRCGGIEGLLLLGPVGTGKTYAALAAGYELYVAGLDVRFTPCARMYRSLRPEGGATIDTYTQPDILIVDDLGTEKVTEWVEETTFTVVDERWAAQRPLIVTSNLTPDQLRGAVGERVYDRLRDGATALHLSGPSRRQPSRQALRAVK